ncbi:MAG: aminotransferase class V-fold PLP-dependent enzyme [Dehalococcoidia bacterium]|nr:aminotransferase class V-fold PLP-dependent enzyme [Dehalococcoidia bacterium]
MELPESGRPWDELRDEMLEMRQDDLAWRDGRHGAFVWYANDELEHVVGEAYSMFLVENGLGVKVFPSIGRMEAETLAMVRTLLHGDEDAAGIFTSGGTESIFDAMFAMREWARATKPGVSRPNVVAPYSAHPALNKAAHLQGFDVVRVPVGPDHAADPAALEAAITSDTIGLYASAPTYSLGIVDPIAEVGAVAERNGLWLHVDACVGGILGNFVRELGYAVPEFDFAVPGVTSISADLHKSGFAAKPASTVTFRTRELREYARFTFDDWPSGIYSSLTFTGTRPAAPSPRPGPRSTISAARATASSPAIRWTPAKPSSAGSRPSQASSSMAGRSSTPSPTATTRSTCGRSHRS